MGPSSACSGASSCLASGLPEGGLRPGPFPRFLGRGVLLSAASSETSDSRPLSPLLEGSTIGRFLLRTWRRGPSSLQRAGLSIFSGLGSSFPVAAALPSRSARGPLSAGLLPSKYPGAKQRRRRVHSQLFPSALCGPLFCLERPFPEGLPGFGRCM